MMEALRNDEISGWSRHSKGMIEHGSRCKGGNCFRCQSQFVKRQIGGDAPEDFANYEFDCHGAQCTQDE